MAYVRGQRGVAVIGFGMRAAENRAPSAMLRWLLPTMFLGVSALFALILAKYVVDLLVMPLFQWFVSWAQRNGPFSVVWVLGYIFVAAFLWGLLIHIIPWLILLFKAPPGKRRDNLRHLDLDVTGKIMDNEY